MLHVTNLLLISLLLLNLAGVSLLVYRFMAHISSGSWLLARTITPLLVTIPFFIEHFVGLRSLAWVSALGSVISAGLVVRHAKLLRANWRIEAVYHGAFAYALAWRYSFPDITPASEKLTDLTMVTNYIGGGRLPPVDRWLPPFPFDFYYSLQHYGAALLGRFLEISAGTAYNFAICVLVATAVTAAAGTAWLLTRNREAAFLLTAALVVGGTGASPFIHWMMPNPQFYSSMRFLGSSLSPQNATRPLGRWLVHADHVSNSSLDLPVELFSYLLPLGDYHPPLGGYVLLMLALSSMALIESDEAAGPAHAALAATVPLTIAVNAWDVPLQAFLCSGYLLYRVWARQAVHWKALAIGGGLATGLIVPFLIRFVPHAIALHNALRWVPSGFHTPLVSGLVVFYPLIAILTLNMICGESSRQSLAWCTIWLALLATSEFLFVDDVYAGKFERFNTVLKWWAWIYSGAFLTVGAINLRSPSRVCRWGTGAVLILISAYGSDLCVNLTAPARPHFGQLDGAAWLRDDPAQRTLLDSLKSQPPGIVLQRLPDRSYIAAPALILFAGQTPLLGWANHEDIWRGYRADIDQRLDEINSFYAGELPGALDWLEQNHVRDILWTADENKLPPGTFEKIDGQISRRYRWKDYSVQAGSRVGVWTLVHP